MEEKTKIVKVETRYRLLKKIGEGGMGQVYKAYDTKLDRVVALKRLSERLAMSATDLKRFQREATSNAKLRHPNIVVVRDLPSIAEAAPPPLSKDRGFRRRKFYEKPRSKNHGRLGNCAGSATKHENYIPTGRGNGAGKNGSVSLRPLCGQTRFCQDIQSP